MISYTVILTVKLSLVFEDSTLSSLLVMWHKTLSVFVTHEHVNSNLINWFASLSKVHGKDKTMPCFGLV